MKKRVIFSPFFYTFASMQKKIFIIVVALLALVSIQDAVAQNGNGFGVGVRAGVNFSDFTSSTGRGRSGFVGGVFGDYTVKRFGFELGAYYSEQGSNGVVEQSLPGNRADYHFDYVLLQVLVKYQIFNGFRVYLGPTSGYLINSQRFYMDEGVRVNEKLTNIRNYDIGITGGVGYTFKFGLDLSASYNRGFGDFFLSNDRESYTSMFRVTVGWNFLRKR